MTFRERLLTTLNGGRPDVMPWFSDLTYWAASQRHQGILPPEYDSPEGFVKLHRDHHVGYYLGYASLWSMRYDGVEVESETQCALTTTVWRTPVGEIVGQSRWLPETFSGAPTRWPVQGPHDLKVLRYIARATVIEPNRAGYDREQELAGDQGHPTVLPPRSPVSQMLAQWSGAETLTYMDADAPDELRLTLDALGDAADGAFDAILASEVPFVEFPDNLSGEIVTPFFKRYQFDYYLKRIHPLHAAGKKVGTHLDGTMRGILPLLVETGLDFIESITPAPVGDVPLEGLRDLAGPDVVLFGGVPGAMFAPPFTEDTVRAHVERIIETQWPHGRFIMGSADQVPPNGSMELVRKIGEWLEELCA